MPSQKERLGEVLASDATDMRATYDAWSATYDAENLGQGFRLPFISAAFFARHFGTRSGTILDAACGTGLVGESLAHLGYGPLIGCDLSEKMRAAAARHGVYQDLFEGNLAALTFAENTFDAFLCVGAFGPGHAPPNALEELARVTKPGGIGVFTLREDTYEEQGFPAVMDALQSGGAWRELQRSGAFRAYLIGEPHLFARAVVVEILR
ncbi:MAG: class I SAM-dependent methyltransferase [Pseudomonadota bacterium]